MNRVLTVVALGLLCVSFAFAVGEQAQDRTQQQDQDQTQDRTQDRAQDQNRTQDQDRDRIGAGVASGDGAQAREQAETQERTRSYGDNRSNGTHGAQVRAAVQTMLQLENRAGGSGQNISAIARKFNESNQVTERAEERIQSRGAFVRFFAGGDAEMAAQIERERVQNQERLRILEQFAAQCPCDEETRAQLREQIRLLEQEQERLGIIAENERARKGLFGWIWK